MNYKILITAAITIMTIPAGAQIQSGKVIYDETMKMDIKLEGDASQYQHLFPKEQKMQHTLYFTADAALFESVQQQAPKEEDVTADASGGPRIRMQMNTPNDKIYTNVKEGKTVEQRDFMGRKFLISGEISKQAWKMTGKQKTILSYPCQEAIMIKDNDTTTAWFTTEIPISAGPHGWAGLPGLILEATRNSNLMITAQSVNPGPVDEGILVAPKGGKKVTKEEFKTIVDAKRKEMGDEGGGNHMIIRIREN